MVDAAPSPEIDTAGGSEPEPIVIDHEGESSLLPYLTVAIGASAGGLEAYIELFEALPPDSGAAFILVPHLPPEQHMSHLPEILTKHTAMPVRHIESEMRPLPDHVLVLPSGMRVSMHGGVLRLESRVANERMPLPIDRFFRSLAADQKAHTIGVILSGADSDGALGLKTIRGEGGVGIVQDPDSAAHPEMPRSSIAADHVDMVLSPAEIGREIARLAKQFNNPALQPLKAGQVKAPTEEQSFGRILTLLRGVSGVDFRFYKQPTIGRRIARRMLLCKVPNLSAYVSFLSAHPDELRALQEDVLINVTRFFRDEEVFAAFKSDLLPRMFAGRPPDQQVRVWIAGCSTGEEAYSIAICLLEYLSGKAVEPQIQIFATDASDRSIEAARAALYPESIADDVSPERLRRFFVKADRGYQVSKRVRDLCIFARQNLCGDPPFSRLDLISCRNVLIYLGPELQKKMIPTFHYALRPTGQLLLGSSESIREHTDMFAITDRKNKFYLKIGGAGHLRLDIATRVPLNVDNGAPSLPRNAREGWSELDVQRAADRIVLARYGPAGVVITERLKILQSRGHTSAYLEMAPGVASLGLLRMVREEIVAPLRDAIQRAIQEDVPVQTEVRLRRGDHFQQVLVEVLPIQGIAAQIRFYLVLFVPTLSPVEAGEPLDRSLIDASEDEKLKLILQLRQDLGSTKLYLQSLLDEREARNQELTSANEEIQSANEELQSTNEELETAKEELQSANEELQTVNEELQNRNLALTQAGNDLSNLLNSVNIPVVMLDGGLEIRQFTPPAQRMMNLRAADIGRPISDVRLNLDSGDLEPLLRDVMETLTPREAQVTDREGKSYLLRVRPYRTNENKIEGVVLVLVDIEQLRRHQLALEQSHAFSQTVLERVQVPLTVVDSEFRICSVNEAFCQLSGLRREDLKGRSLPELAGELWRLPNLRAFIESLHNSPDGEQVQVEHQTGDVPPRVFRLTVQPVRPQGSRLLLVTLEDRTHERRVQRMLEEEREQLAGKVRATEHVLERTREELRALAAGLFNSQEEERRRVARELHDDVSQRLAFLELEIERVRLSMPEKADEAIHALQQLKERTGSLSEDVRRMSHHLHPALLDDLGLDAALKGLVDEFRKRFAVLADFHSRNVPEVIAGHPATAIYRIAQEALHNVEKHAGKTHVKVILEGRPDGLRLEVADFGEGFDTEDSQRGLGLISMEERARLVGGNFSVKSELGKGTVVNVEIPLHGSGDPN